MRPKIAQKQSKALMLQRPSKLHQLLMRQRRRKLPSIQSTHSLHSLKQRLEQATNQLLLRPQPLPIRSLLHQMVEVSQECIRGEYAFQRIRILLRQATCCSLPRLPAVLVDL
jgi:hypothetical protein